jgi:hypothetical protein
VTRQEWKLDSFYLDLVLMLMQDRCTVCVERTKAQKSFWTHPMILLGDLGLVESCFSLFEDSVSVSAR